MLPCKQSTGKEMTQKFKRASWGNESFGIYKGNHYLIYICNCWM